ncbi:UNKNOWN [Stylonychia lemnae]|uniref:60s ribosomal protein l35a n=1 Tax=Stylonychia lemnae TaxID=5949 RepID=A0A078AYJ1_STYLE|nr:UNKNOWN [Stylonychia lemnae]|eukprot:CDW87234.1 UNKNOWN [Stylonychia lemnae]
MGKEADKQSKSTKVHKKTQPVRLYTKAVFTGFKRGKSTQHEQFALLKIKGVNDKKDTSSYFGKRVAYIFKVKNTSNNTRFRVIWGRVVKSHGNNGSVRAKFARNLPPRAMGSTLRVMLYPNRAI